MQEIEYSAPQSLEEAIALLVGAKGKARLLAGGTDLLVQLKNGDELVRGVRHLVDLKRIDGFDNLRDEPDGGLGIGAAVPCFRVGANDFVRAHFPGLAEAAALIGSDQIQSRATIAGNLCNASPAADTVPALVALGAECIIAGPNGQRSIPASDFTRGPSMTTLGEGEILTEVKIPAQPAGGADAYQRFIPRNEMDIAVVGVAAQVAVDSDGRCSHARIALGAVGPRVIDAGSASEVLVGRELDDDALHAAAGHAQEVATPISDKRGPAEYRLSLVGTLTRRVLAVAAERAKARKRP